MRSLIKLIMKLHIKLWCWGESWGEREVFAKGAHFSNAVCNAVDKPGTFVPFMFGSLVGHEMSRTAGESWLPTVWKLFIFMLLPFAVLDFVISVFDVVYILFIRIFIRTFILLPLWKSGGWEGDAGGGWGNFSNEYLKNIWLEVDAEHDLYVAQNLLCSRELFQC